MTMWGRLLAAVVGLSMTAMLSGCGSQSKRQTEAAHGRHGTAPAPSSALASLTVGQFETLCRGALGDAIDRAMPGIWSGLVINRSSTETQCSWSGRGTDTLYAELLTRTPEQTQQVEGGELDTDLAAAAGADRAYVLPGSQRSLAGGAFVAGSNVLYLTTEAGPALTPDQLKTMASGFSGGRSTNPVPSTTVPNTAAAIHCPSISEVSSASGLDITAQGADGPNLCQYSAGTTTIGLDRDPLLTGHSLDAVRATFTPSSPGGPWTIKDLSALGTGAFEALSAGAPHAPGSLCSVYVRGSDGNPVVVTSASMNGNALVCDPATAEKVAVLVAD